MLHPLLQNTSQLRGIQDHTAFRGIQLAVKITIVCGRLRLSVAALYRSTSVFLTYSCPKICKKSSITSEPFFPVASRKIGPSCLATFGDCATLTRLMLSILESPQQDKSGILLQS
jgi:hypothetical protein